MKKTYIRPETDITHTEPFHILAGSLTMMSPQGENVVPITKGEGDGGGDPGSFTNKGLWEEE